MKKKNSMKILLTCITELKKQVFPKFFRPWMKMIKMLSNENKNKLNELIKVQLLFGTVRQGCIDNVRYHVKFTI